MTESVAVDANEVVNQLVKRALKAEKLKKLLE